MVLLYLFRLYMLDLLQYNNFRFDLAARKEEQRQSDGNFFG